MESNDIVFTTYGTLGAEFSVNVGELTEAPLLKAKWLRVCLDEGHFIKNSNAKTAKAAKLLNAKRKWIISGTPIQNNLSELWSLLHWLDVQPYAEKRSLFKNQIENRVKVGDRLGLRRLQTLVQAICLRRTKSDKVNGKPLVQLPEKKVIQRELDFSDDERAVYEAYQSKGREIIERYMRRGTLMNNYAHVFAVMMRLRQLCCHRELLPVQWGEVNMNEIVELAAQEQERALLMQQAAANANGVQPEAVDDMNRRLAEQLRDMIKAGMTDDCSICLSDVTSPVITKCSHIFCRECITQVIQQNRPPAPCPLCRGNIFVQELLEAAQSNDEEEEEDAKNKENDEKEEDVDQFPDIVVDVSSSKINAVIKELKGIRRDYPGEKTIIVSQFTSLLSIMQPLLTEENYNWTRLDGSMSARQRSEVIADFQSSKASSPTVLLLSLRAGGVGLNLTAASRMMLLDPAWNPATEEQCFDRIHRLGQVRDVKIIKFVMKNSIEQRMLAIQEKKRNLIAGAFRQSDSERRAQRIQDILDLFGIGPQPNNASQ